MEKEQFAQVVKMLHDPEIYFGRVSQLMDVSGFSTSEAWLHVENNRSEFGLPPWYSTYDSFRKAKSTYHSSGGLIRLLEEWPD